MLLVPRGCEHYQGISFNSLAFAGYFLARDQDALDFLQAQDLLTVISALGIPKNQ